MPLYTFVTSSTSLSWSRNCEIVKCLTKTLASEWTWFLCPSTQNLILTSTNWINVLVLQAMHCWHMFSFFGMKCQHVLKVNSYDVEWLPSAKAIFLHNTVIRIDSLLKGDTYRNKLYMLHFCKLSVWVFTLTQKIEAIASLKDFCSLPFMQITNNCWSNFQSLVTQSSSIFS